jgi:hypothetical protein
MNDSMNLKTAIKPQINDHGRSQGTANRVPTFQLWVEASEPKSIVVHPRFSFFSLSLNFRIWDDWLKPLCRS